MDDDFINYGHLIDDAMHIIVKKALQKVIKEGLPGKHHFFISFATNYPGVKISENLKKKYPEEITIVLQHQFDSLEVTDEGFSVILSFNNVKEKVSVPFPSLVAFADPSVKFGLQFRQSNDTGLATEIKNIPDANNNAIKLEAKLTGKNTKDTKKKLSKKETSKVKNENNVVSIDNFRKK